MPNRKANVQQYGCQSVVELARKIGYSRASVSTFLLGKSHGGRKLREKLEALKLPSRPTKKDRLGSAISDLVEAWREYASAEKRATGSNP